MAKASLPLCFRDKSIIVWNLTHEEGTYGQAKRALKGHSHFVQDVVISSDGQFALSGVQIKSVQPFSGNAAVFLAMHAWSYRFMGWHSPFVGPELRQHNQEIHWTQQGCSQCGFLCGQQTGTCLTNDSRCDSCSLLKASNCIVNCNSWIGLS